MSDVRFDNAGRAAVPERAEPLLAYVVGRLRDDRGLTPRRGTVHLGVRRGTTVRWLGVAFESAGLRPFLPDDPAAADAALVISGDAADALFDDRSDTAAVDTDAFRIFGDAELARLLWARCVTRTDLLALRIQARTPRDAR